MFEDEQSAVAELLGYNIQFRELHEQHESLKCQVRDAVTGVHPIGDLALTQLKRRKLLTKDRMANIIQQHHLTHSD